MRRLLNMYLSYMKLSLEWMAIAALCFFIFGLVRANSLDPKIKFLFFVIALVIYASFHYKKAMRFRPRGQEMIDIIKGKDKEVLQFVGSVLGVLTIFKSGQAKPLEIKFTLNLKDLSKVYQLEDRILEFVLGKPNLIEDFLEKGKREDLSKAQVIHALADHIGRLAHFNYYLKKEKSKEISLSMYFEFLLNKGFADLFIMTQDDNILRFDEELKNVSLDPREALTRLVKAIRNLQWERLASKDILPDSSLSNAAKLQDPTEP